MNNVISIVVDSVIQDYVGTKLCKVSPTPFIDSLKREGVEATNMFSPGPFTDAATRSLYTGRDCLDDYSFFFKYSMSPVNHYKVFKENGYETLGLFYPYYIMGSNVTNYIDQIYYTSGFAFSSEWFGMFSYFADKAKISNLTRIEEILLQHRLELLFDVWIKFYQDLINIPDSSIMIEKCIGIFDVIDALENLHEQYNKYKCNKKEYLYDFLRRGNEHTLANLDKINFEGYIDRNFLNKNVFKRHKNDFKLFKKKNFKANWWVNRPRIGRFFYALKESIINKNINEFIFIANYYLCLTSFSRMKRQSSMLLWQYEQSSYRHFETAKFAIENRKTEKPFYLSIHVEEPHNFIACFTYDSQDQAIIDDDFNCLTNYVKQLDCDFVGDLSYILSLRYVDYHIEKFCNYLKDKKLWDNTTILICADHGSSYSFYPLHNKHVNCFDKECYHIPMIIRHPGMQGKVVNSYCNSKDILPTLLDLVGITPYKEFRGHSIISNYEDKGYVITEYPGGGCPDVNSKKLWLSIRDNKFVVAYIIDICENINECKPEIVYDLTNDSFGFYNIRNMVNNEDISYLITPLSEYFNEIKERTLKFVNKIVEDEIL